MPIEIPLFPLPNVVLFPKTLRPLHIFEPRYRKMIESALEGEHLVGMTLLKEGWEEQYDQTPPVEKRGTLGKIVQSNRLPDGRYYITLLGISTFDIEEETSNEEWRTALVSVLRPESRWPLAQADMDRIGSVVSEVLTQWDLTSELKWINESAKDPISLLQHWSAFLPFTATERQFLLEAPDIRTQAGRLYDLLLFKKITFETEMAQENRKDGAGDLFFDV
ncbi:MAG: LON peptidase substrate-binding domain-containing protein [Leptospirales bacterium]